MLLSLPHALLATGLSAMAVVQAVAGGRGVAALLVAVSGTAVLALVHRWPLPVAVAIAASVAAQPLLHDGDPVFASFVAAMAACYGLGRRSGPRALAAGLLALAAAVAALLVADASLRTPAELVFPLVYFGGSTALGRLVRSRQRVAEAAQRAAVAEAEARADAALAAERARIAREMHDVVAHSVSLLVLQAESAAAVLPTDPHRALVQLERVADGGRQALDELRRLLGVLRSDDDPELAGPQPSLAALEELAASVRRAGTAVELDVEPGLHDLPPGLQLTAYRLVQESVTNALRHGRATRLAVRLHRCGDELVVAVTDDGAAVPGTSPSGHGLAGMRERLRLYDGHLDAGPAADGGWQVTARARVGAG